MNHNIDEFIEEADIVIEVELPGTLTDRKTVPTVTFQYRNPRGREKRETTWPEDAEHYVRIMGSR